MPMLKVWICLGYLAFLISPLKVSTGTAWPTGYIAFLHGLLLFYLLKKYKNDFLEQKMQELGFLGNSHEIAKAVKKLKKLKESLRGQVAYLEEKFVGNGLDHPPCWVNKSGKIEYLYIITIHEERLKVSPAWPNSRKIDVAEIPSANIQKSKMFSISQPN